MPTDNMEVDEGPNHSERIDSESVSDVTIQRTTGGQAAPPGAVIDTSPLMSVPKFSSPPRFPKQETNSTHNTAGEVQAVPSYQEPASGPTAMPTIPKFRAPEQHPSQNAARQAAVAAAVAADAAQPQVNSPPCASSENQQPVSDISQKAPQLYTENAARKAATSAAMDAVRRAAPAQRERAIEIAMQAATRSHTQDSAASGVPKTEPKSKGVALIPSDMPPALINSTGYQAPGWGQSFPDTDDVFIEVMRTGTIVDTVQFRCKDHFTFGRHPDADCTVEHASTSRLHAVVQFKGTEAFLVDCGSTHGSFLNKQQLTPLLYYPLPVGAQFRLGQSSRSYILTAPMEWMAAEGPNKAERAQLRQQKLALSLVAKHQAKDRKASEVAMRKALQGEMMWGMGEDAEVDEVDEFEIDWLRLYDGGRLNDRQQKSAEKIRAKEWKIKNMREESKRIRSKDNAQGGLTSGQAETLVRNEQGCDKLQEEVENMAEELCDSIRGSIKDKRDTKAREAELAQPSKRTVGSRDEDSSDSDDDFFDRTKRRKVGVNGSKATADAALVHTAASLCVKLHELCLERTALKAQVMQAEIAVMESPSGTATDALDAFMTGLQESEAQSKLRSLQSTAALLDAQIEQTRQLLKIADPAGNLREGSEAANAAIAASSSAAPLLPNQDEPVIAARPNETDDPATPMQACPQAPAGAGAGTDACPNASSDILVPVVQTTKPEEPKKRVIPRPKRDVVRDARIAAAEAAVNESLAILKSAERGH